MWVREWAGDLRLKPKSASVSVVERLVWKREKKSEWEERVWGENKPRAAQHAAVSNKQFGVSISSQPSTWKIWISNLATACYVLWDAESFYGSVSLPFIGWKLIVELHFGSPPKSQGREGDASLCLQLLFWLKEDLRCSSAAAGHCWHWQIPPSRCATAPSLALLSTTLILVCTGKDEFCPV